MKLEELSVLRCGNVMANSEPYLVSESKSRSSTGVPNGEVFSGTPSWKPVAKYCRLLANRTIAADTAQHAPSLLVR
jgi:hypothetical protein